MPPHKASKITQSEGEGGQCAWRGTDSEPGWETQVGTGTQWVPTAPDSQAKARCLES